MNPAELTKSEQKKLITKATQAINSAYAPYSQFRVGAAVLTSTGTMFAGCNVENASYGLTMCAERNAIANAIIGSGQDTIIIKAIAIANSQNIPCPPCGACRQVIWELGKNARVIFRGTQEWQTSTIKDLLPVGFSL
jgi:cytidine deaminase